MSRYSILPGDRIVGIGRIHAGNATRFHCAATLLTSNWPIIGTALLHLERGYAGEFPDIRSLVAHFLHAERKWQEYVQLYALFLHAERKWQEYVQLYALGGELSTMMQDVTRGD